MKYQRLRLERSRAKMVRDYRANPRVWPDGIDSKYDRWYAHPEEWTEERIAKLLDETVKQNETETARETEINSASETDPETKAPWEVAGVSRATWYRQQREGKREP